MVRGWGDSDLCIWDFYRAGARQWGEKVRVAVLSGDPGLMGSMARELEREKAWSRIHLVPLLLAGG